MKDTNGRKIKKIGLFGVGTIGRIILKKLLQAGYILYAYDPSEEAQSFIMKTGAIFGSNIKEVSKEVHACILSLPDPKSVLEVVDGNNGIVTNAKSGIYIIDTSTIDPYTTKKAAKIARNYGQIYLDAPLLGRPSAPAGWVSPVGGNDEDFCFVRTLIESYTSRAIHVGPLGTGSTLKLLNQIMFSTINCITCEVMAICAKTQLSPRVLYDTIVNSGASTVSGLFKEIGIKICESNYSPEFTINLLAKDSKLAQEMAINYYAPSMLLNNVNFINLLALSKGYGAEDTSALYKIYLDLYDNEISRSSG